MTITEIMRASDSFTDENCTSAQGMSYVNEAIAIINSNGYSLPFFDNAGTNYPYLSETWQRRLLCLRVSYGIKMNDTSLSEAMEYKYQFDRALEDLLGKATTIIPEEYQGYLDGDGNKVESGIGGVYRMNTENAINKGWFGNRRGGGN